MNFANLNARVFLILRNPAMYTQNIMDFVHNQRRMAQCIRYLEMLKIWRNYFFQALIFLSILKLLAKHKQNILFRYLLFRYFSNKEALGFIRSWHWRFWFCFISKLFLSIQSSQASLLGTNSEKTVVSIILTERTRQLGFAPRQQLSRHSLHIRALRSRSSYFENLHRYKILRNFEYASKY